MSSIPTKFTYYALYLLVDNMIVILEYFTTMALSTRGYSTAVFLSTDCVLLKAISRNEAQF